MLTFQIVYIWHCCCLHHSCNEERSSSIHILGIYCSILSDTFTKFMVDITDKVITVILVDFVDYIQSGSSQQFLWWIFRLKSMFDHVFNLLQLRNQRHYQRVVILFLHYHITSFYQPCRWSTEQLSLNLFCILGDLLLSSRQQIMFLFLNYLKSLLQDLELK